MPSVEKRYVFEFVAKGVISVLAENEAEARKSAECLAYWNVDEEKCESLKLIEIKEFA